ncbi:FMN-binding negative transcriptional regulator [Sulfitobacter sp. LCG007]
MHPNPIYHTESSETNLAYARERGFGTLAVCGTDGPLLSHVPFLLDEDGGHAWLHLVRSNPIARALRDGPLACKIAANGPHSYVSPDWYGIEDQVPTWNYVAVHLSGRLELRPAEDLREVLDRQSAFFERQLLPKPEWLVEKMPPDALEKMMRVIVPCRMAVTGVDGTWKLNQNKPEDVRLSAARHVEAYGLGSEIATLAALMRGS